MLPYEKRYRTGYFANTKRGTKTHVVDETGKPICGRKFKSELSFQLCSYGIYGPYVECPRCKDRALAIRIKFNKMIMV